MDITDLSDLDDKFLSYEQMLTKEERREERDKKIQEYILQAKEVCRKRLAIILRQIAPLQDEGFMAIVLHDHLVIDAQHDQDKEWLTAIMAAKRVYGVRPVERMLSELELDR